MLHNALQIRLLLGCESCARGRKLAIRMAGGIVLGKGDLVNTHGAG